MNNERIMRVSRLVNSISLTSQDAEYDFANIFIDGDNSNRSDSSDSNDLTL